MDNAAHYLKDSTGNRELCRPVRIDKDTERASGVGLETEHARRRALEVEEHTDRCRVVDGPRIRNETSKLRSDVGQLGTRDVRQPKIGANQGHVVSAVALHAFPFGAARLRRLLQSQLKPVVLTIQR